MAYIKTYRTYNACFILLYSFCVRQFLVQIMLDVHSEIHIGLQWCVNYWCTWTKTGTLINFNRLTNKKFQWKFVQGLEFLYADTNRQTSIVKLRDTLLQLFITNMPKKLLDLSWKCYQALFAVVELLKSMPNLTNECSRENFTQLAHLPNIKMKQEFELIILDIKVICYMSTSL